MTEEILTLAETVSCDYGNGSSTAKTLTELIRQLKTLGVDNDCCDRGLYVLGVQYPENRVKELYHFKE